MPIKEFACTECEHIFERTYLSSAIADEDIRNRDIRCPNCSSNDVEKVISRVAPPQFKGSGFYATDYK